MPAPVPPGWVDAHVHLLPLRRTRSLMRWTHRGIPECPIPEDTTAEQALEHLRGAGAAHVINLLFPLVAGEADELHAFGAELMAREPDITCLGGVHAEDEDPAGVVRRAIEDHGMRGLKLHPMVQRTEPGDPRLASALEALAGYRLPLYVHTGFEEFYGWAYPVEQLEEIARRHPEMPLVLCHANCPNFAWAADMARRHPNVWLDLTNATMFRREPASPARDALEVAFRDLFAAAPDRLIFGTDHPPTYDWPERLYAELLAWTPELAPALRDNARRLVGLAR
ncbi:MAG: amidohydrolase 2 [Solirubrobacterales bacterium]|jgi:predicted TIM-barrel fold metal-dependent hydrolase|nr:amidohydrolase 2 [Solirubrobacterales bacterium]